VDDKLFVNFSVPLFLSMEILYRYSCSFNFFHFFFPRHLFILYSTVVPSSEFRTRALYHQRALQSVQYSML
jgi:hypothetical protein